MSSAWKVAYADFMTAMMAFFLLMWLLSVLTEEQKAGISGMFRTETSVKTYNLIPIGTANNPLVQYVDKLQIRDYKMDEIETSFSVSRAIRQFLMQHSLQSTATGITSDNLGVLLHVSSDLMFKPGTVEFTRQGKTIMDEIISVSSKFKMYLVVRGHTDASETGEPNFSSKWELASARANAAVRYLIGKGMNPAFIRSVSYADTRPKVPPDTPGALETNGRVEFNFHRQDTMSTIVGY